MGKPLRTYTEDQTDEGQGSEESTGIASCFAWFLPISSALYDPDNGYFTADRRSWGLIDGDPAMIENMLKNFVNETGMISKNIGNQLTGTAGTKISLKLKNLTEDAIARMHGGSNDPIIGTSRNPGTRKKVFTFSGVLDSGSTVAWSFKTTNTATGAVSSVTAVSVIYNTSDLLTGADLTAAVTANTGILSAVYDATAHTLTVLTKPNYYITTTVTGSKTGGSTTLTTQTETDSAILTTAVAAANGAIGRKSFGVTTGGGAILQTAITNGTFSGVPGKPQIRILTGATVTSYEYPRIARIVGDVVYLIEPLKNLPADLAVVEVVATVDYLPVGLSFPENVDVLLEFRNHSDKSEYMVHIKNGSHDTGTKPPNFTKEGFKGNIDLLCLDTLVTANGVQKLLPYTARKVNSAVGNE